jgi:ethanolamine utilization protein EutP (predicted NTPase)
MGLSEQESIQKYGTVAYTGWNEPEAGYDARAHPEKLNTYYNQPQSSAQVTPYLANFQNSELAKAQDVALETLTTMPPPPEPISRVEEFEKLRTQYGVSELEEYLVDLKAQEEFLYAEQRVRTGAERGKPVPMGVISGRISEVERQQGERIDLVRRLKATAIDQLNVAYNVISTYINYMGLDYQDAVDSYNSEFQRNLSIYGAITTARGQELDIAKFGYQIEQDQRNLAAANLQTMINAITSGNISYNDLPADQQSLIRKLELQAGLPVGFTSNLKMSKEDSMLFQTSVSGITQVGYLQPDGSVRVEEYGRYIKSPGSGKLTSAEQQRQDAAEMNAILQLLGGDDNIVSGSQWAEARGDWVQQGYSAADFDAAFRRYTNPDWDNYVGIDID